MTQTGSTRYDSVRSTRDRKDAYVRTADSSKYLDPMDSVLSAPATSARTAHAGTVTRIYVYLKDSLADIRQMARAGLGGHGFSDDSANDAIQARAHLDSARRLMDSLPGVPDAIAADYQRARGFFETARNGMPSLWRVATTPALDLQRIVDLIPDAGRDWGAYEEQKGQ